MSEAVDYLAMSELATPEPEPAKFETFCILCRAAIPAERAARRSNTCSKEHSTLLAQGRRRLVAQRRCQHCSRPSTPEEREQYQRWRKEQKKKLSVASCQLPAEPTNTPAE